MTVIKQSHIVDIDALPSPLREWLASVLQRQDRIMRAKDDGDGLEVTLCMKRDGYIPPPKIKSY